jgi:hypothetical protein
MPTPKTQTIRGWVRGAAALVYRETVDRARLLFQAFVRNRHDLPFEDVLAVNAEPTVLPEPLLRSKVS